MAKIENITQASSNDASELTLESVAIAQLQKEINDLKLLIKDIDCAASNASMRITSIVHMCQLAMRNPDFYENAYQMSAILTDIQYICDETSEFVYNRAQDANSGFEDPDDDYHTALLAMYEYKNRIKNHVK